MNLKPAVIFNDNMVLQRRQNIKIFGTHDGKAHIQANLGEMKAEADVSSDGEWELQFPPMEAGGPFKLEISSGSEELCYSNIFIGDVWLCSGQSNMVIPMQRVQYTYPDEIKEPYQGPVHMLSIPEVYAFDGPAQNLPHGNWQIATPENISQFSAVAWFFGTRIHAEEGIPVGLIVAAVGGTPIQSWLPREAFAQFPDIMKSIEPYRSEGACERQNAKEQSLCDAWFNELNTGDPGLTESLKWYDPSYDCSDWNERMVPEQGEWAPWKTMGPEDDHGSYWLQFDLDIEEDLAGKPGLLWLGRIIDSDTVWLNGQKIGETGYEYPPRIYPISGGLLKTGSNRVTVRVLSQNSPVSFVPDKPYYLEVAGRRISLEGRWRIRQGKVMHAFPGTTRFVTKPECLFNAMIAPLLPLPITGVCWYQGESNIGDADIYNVFLTLLIREWRRLWGRDELPFIIAQLPCYGPVSKEMEESGWAILRNYQRDASNMPYTTLAVALDAGEWNDIHPLRKKPVGERFAQAALSLVYGHDDIFPSPKPVKGFRNNDGKLVINFSEVNGSIDVRGDISELHLFISENKGPFFRADARLDDNSLFILNIPKGETTVRYAWADNPGGALLYSTNGIPVSPFEITVE